jgi:TRAP-type C4-dicarboxylate transport system substrate-binding protein
VLKYSDPSSTGTARTDAVEWWAKEIEKRTEGRVKFEYYWSESLAKARDNINATKGGVADVSFLASWGYHPSDFPVWQFSELLFLGEKEFPHLTAVKEMYQTVPELKEEADKTGLKLLWMGSTQPTNFLTKKPIRTLEDFKGLKIRSVGAVADWVKSLGGVSSPITIYETYEALQKGTVDGSQGYMYQFLPYKWQEVTKYLNTTGIQLITFSIWMNKDVWNKLTPADQKVFEDMWGDLTNKLVEEYGKSYQKDLKGLKDAGVEVVEPSPAEAARWRESAVFTWDKWLKAMEGKGIDGKKILAKYEELYKKYDKR